MKHLTVAQAAYIAGFLEGEGSFVLGKTRGYHKPCVSVAQVDPKPLIHLQKFVGGRITYKPNNGFSGNPIYIHQITSRQPVMELVKVVYPYLISPRTRKRAWCVYRMAALKRQDRGGKPLSQENLEKREKIYRIWETTRR